jgi:hypothetical protein
MINFTASSAVLLVPDTPGAVFAAVAFAAASARLSVLISYLYRREEGL